jgi:8-oxo-dGTP diphosphatase
VAGESHDEALRREMREELDTDVEVGPIVATVTHAYPDRRVTLHFHRCRLAGTPRPLLGQEMRWVPRAELAALGFPPADEELIALLTGDQARRIG